MCTALRILVPNAWNLKLDVIEVIEWCVGVEMEFIYTQDWTHVGIGLAIGSKSSVGYV